MLLGSHAMPLLPLPQPRATGRSIGIFNAVDAQERTRTNLLMIRTIQGTSTDVVIVHDSLGFGICRLGLGVPILWTDIHNIEDFRRFTESRSQPLRIVTKFPNQSEIFLAAHAIRNYRLLYQDGALEAATQLGTADCIIDLISSGVTLRENNLKEIPGGTILQSEMQLIGNRSRLAADQTRYPFAERLRDFVRELIERMDAHFTAQQHYNVIANIRGESAGDVARRLGEFTDLRGLDGPTISTVIPPRGVAHGMYAIGLVVKKTQIYSAMKQLRRVGGSGVCVLPVTFVFEGTTDRWKRLCEELQIPFENDEWKTMPRPFSSDKL